MLLDVILIVVGLALLLAGGDLLVRGASAIAKALNVPPIVIGLTVVAFGTSAPELSVNVLAAIDGNTQVSFGNVVGSNIANIGLILGICAFIRPLVIQGTIIEREIPMMLLASFAALILASDNFLLGEKSSFDRSDGLILLLLFAVFMYYTIVDVIKGRQSDPLLQQIEEEDAQKGFGKGLLNTVFLLLGLAMLIGGGQLAVDYSVKVASLLGVPSVIIGLTIIAIGTSLPELVSCGLATWKGHTDIAIGSVIGSNIFNLLLVSGICSTITEIEVPTPAGSVDLLMMVFLSVLILPLSLSFKFKLVRIEGAVLFSLYFVFMGWRVMTVI
ncbi:MAG: calcium/sodium antiporter [Pseudohongiellaceae bacterium]